ncbi:helix-turn-helix transcriptional regulator [Aquamicrobium sp. LC103]|uniref:helix-turn-helix transcriptional regulator n=1 Tax=Aquamicrobium sp. LC103 TaxID=1120658 RepID=UPI00063E9C6C|nr:helix-turn-helix transcriptional regulator [Aquamicrobium sp. LC103]TKT79977.1 helix-turn-helix transcriptional regulator [Aquamicrobium sp. LC103]
MITGPICKAARAIVEVSRSKLAENSNVDGAVIEMFERGIDTPSDETIASLQAALEELGAIFIPEEGSNGAGVRLKFSRSVTKRLGNLENEGGPSAKDDVQ